jgi:hypothetical protein
MGVTPTKGAETPAYSPRASPSFAIVLRTTSMAPVYTPFSEVCNRTLTRSNGWPTTTAQIPPTPPATSARSDWSEDLVATLTSSLSSPAEGSFSAIASLVFVMVGSFVGPRGATAQKVRLRGGHRNWSSEASAKRLRELQRPSERILTEDTGAVWKTANVKHVSSSAPDLGPRMPARIRLEFSVPRQKLPPSTASSFVLGGASLSSNQCMHYVSGPCSHGGRANGIDPGDHLHGCSFMT